MRVAALALVLFAADAVGGADSGFDAARRLLAQGRFAAALEALEDEPEERLRRLGRADVFYLARDFARSLEEARSGLAGAPGDRQLLFRATSAALWLRREDEAARLAQRLEDAVSTLADGGAEGPWWREESARLAGRARDLIERREARIRALLFARLVAGGLLAVTLGLFAWATARPGALPGLRDR